MARPIRALEIYLPLEYNDGRPIEDVKFVSLQQELVNRFGGVTSTQKYFPLQGLWQSPNRVFQDRIVVLNVMDFSGAKQLEIIQYLTRLKNRLKKKFAQLEILITFQELLAV
jgi:hypothetical protein